MRALPSILGIRLEDRITNLEVLDRAHSTCVESMLLKAQLCWVGHVIRMEEHRMPRRLLYRERLRSKRRQGRPKKRYKDTVKAGLQWCELKPKELEEATSERSPWRSRTHKAVENFDDTRRQKLTAARDQRHRAPAAAVTTTGFQCPHCSRLCASRLGLQSHLRCTERLVIVGSEGQPPKS